MAGLNRAILLTTTISRTHQFTDVSWTSVQIQLDTHPIITSTSYPASTAPVNQDFDPRMLCSVMGVIKWLYTQFER
ncbi:hypothetical protein CY34DRAFT_359554 [Suillus luteus UH-Slu-Lm8-n1]|uniref:Unplaced genomic scaffold CY34scaffold_23, whole genome shotgun sequence n=1 Tax=Suillus luteus UH-Slu-Lm8-n1 TaxID=930992 RepID=A0A0D0AYQ6_9AGAM|nr:hypothetical protein CY34DRAFT_359554 [Suillus luteus UH-Slu-Lm8-n1]